MGACCTKPSVCEKNDEVRDRTILILHAYHELPDTAQGQYTRKRRGSFVLIEHEAPLKKIRTHEMIACLEEFMSTSKIENDKN